MLSVVIIAKDEADRIAFAIRSVAFADEILVLDSGSRDDTVAVATAAGARVEVTDWPGHVAQKNRGLERARGDWVLSIDADEVVSEPLRGAILAALAAPGDAVGFRVARRNVWLGRPLGHGGWYPDRRVRLARRAGARWVGVDPHDQLDVRGPVRDLVGDLVHTPYRSFAEHLATIDRYTRTSAAGLRARGVRARWFDFLRAPWHFLRAWVFQQGFRDGLPGLVLAALGAVYVLLKWGRVADPSLAEPPAPASPSPRNES